MCTRFFCVSLANGGYGRDPSDVICPSGLCRPYLDGYRLYFDNSHLSAHASEALGKLVLLRYGLPLPVRAVLAR